MSEKKKLSILLKGIIQENPVLILVLGTCPTLATTSSVISAFSMGIVATLVLVCSNIVISALRRVIPDTVRIPCYIVIIASFVTAMQMLLQAYLHQNPKQTLPSSCTLWHGWQPTAPQPSFASRVSCTAAVQRRKSASTSSTITSLTA